MTQQKLKPAEKKFSEPSSKMKKTEIGMIPEDWDIQKIEDLFDIKVGGDLHKLQYSETKDHKFKYPIYSNSVEREGVLGYATDYQYQDGCITITARGTLGYAFPRYDQFNAVVRLLILIPKKKVELVFVAHYINNNINFNLEKTSIPQLTAPKIARYIIPFPPLPEQKSISEVLSTVDARLDIVERESQRVERLKVGLMKELFDGKKWKLQKITDIFEIETGTTPSTKEKEYWTNGTVNWITPADMNNLNNTLDLPESRRKITQKALKEVNLTLMPIGSIVISTRAPVGYIGLVKKELTFNQGCKGLIPKDTSKVNTIFYAYYLLSLQEYLNNISGGSTFKELSKDSLCKLEMPVPSISEQNEIANILLTVDKKLSIQKSKKSKLESIKKSLMNDLLTGKKRVKVSQ